MSQRVLSTQQAKTAVTQIRSLLDSGLQETIQRLNQQGQTLSDPNVWDGQLASQFRSEVWPQCKSSLDKTLTSLQELQGKVQRINDDIMAAGGSR